MASLSSLKRALDITRALSQGNPHNVELHVAVALVLIERADALVALSRKPGQQATDRAGAERDYVEALEILEALKNKGEIEGTDVDTLEKTRTKLQTLRAST